MSRNSVSILDRAKTAIVLDHPFFASLLLKRPLIEDNTIPTAGVDARGQIYYNAKFIESLSVPQCVFLLCHEVMHMVYQHPARVGHRQKKRWNIAGDAVINDILIQSKIGEFIDAGVNMPGSAAKTADAIYNELPEQQDGGGGDGPGGIGDDLLERGGPMSSDEEERVSAQNRIDVAAAANAAKMVGNMPGALAKIINEIIEVKTPWYEILEQYMTARLKGDYTWQRPNRRYIGQGIYLPSVGTVPKMGPIVVQIDVSGSISKQELSYYDGHLSRIISQCNPEKVHVMYTDTRVCRHDVFEIGEEVRLEFYSGGGTHMPAGFDYLKEQGIEPEVFVCLTDGYTDFGSDPGYDVVWCISSNVDAPWGKNVHFELGE
jgi:predicted metal-dependent peptidase